MRKCVAYSRIVLTVRIKDRVYHDSLYCHYQVGFGNRFENPMPLYLHALSKPENQERMLLRYCEGGMESNSGTVIIVAFLK